MQRILERREWCIAPAVGAVVVFVTGAFWYNVLVLCRIPIPGLLHNCERLPPLTFDAPFVGFEAREYAARVTWGSTAILSFFGSVVAAAFASYVILVALRGKRARPWVLAGAATVAVLAIVVQWLNLDKDGDSLDNNPFFLAYRVLGPSVGQYVAIDRIAAVMTGLPYAAGIFVIAAVCCTLVDGDGGAHPLDRLHAQVERLQLSLYSGAAVLILAVLNAHALFRWPLAFVDPSGRAAEQRLAEIEAIASAFATMNGTFYSILLAAAYFPAMLILRSRAVALAAGPGQQSRVDIEQELEKRGITISLSRRAANVLAILGPLLASNPVGALGVLFGE
jgi:hypothetical protein